MNPYRFFSNLTKLITLLLIVQCTTSRKYSEDEISTLLSVKDNSGSVQPMFDQFCFKGKQKRPVTRKIKLVLPKQAQGQIVTDAAEADQEIHRRAREIIKNYFAIGQTWGQPFKMPLQRDRNGNDLILGLTSKGEKDLIGYFKGAVSPSELWPSIIEQDASSKKAVLGFVPLPAYVFKSVDPRLKNQPSTLERAGRAGGVLATISPSTLDVSDQEQQVFPLMMINPEPSRSFSKEFTMLIPAEVQAKLFKRSTHSEIVEGDSHVESKAMFVDSDGRFNIKQAVARKDKIWEIYLEELTTVKEAQTSDPQIINYEINLDLNPFCTYGRKVSDLVTK